MTPRRRPWGPAGPRWRPLPRGLRIVGLLTPGLAVIVVLFLGGLVQAAAQSLGYVPFLPGWHWSTDAYRQAWHDPAVRASFALTARVAALSTVAATTLGVAAALAIRGLGRGRRLVATVFQANLPVAHIVGALTMLLLLDQSGLASRLAHHVGLASSPAAFPALTADTFGWGIIADYVWKETPFVGVVVLATLTSGVAELEAVAQTLGAGAWPRFRRVTLPLLLPAVAATSIVVFAFTFGSYEVPFLLGRPYPAALAVVAYQDFQNPDLAARPEAMAISVAIAAVTVVLVSVYLAAAKRLIRRSP